MRDKPEKPPDGKDKQKGTKVYMKIHVNELVQSIATALDIVENEILGASTYHGKRIAILCSLMGKELGMSESEIKAVTTSAMFHDNALTEYVLYMYENNEPEMNLRLHCEYGQRNLEKIPMDFDVSDLVLYHHEEADGKGPFGKRDGEFPVAAALIAIADTIDVENHLQRLPAEELSTIQKIAKEETGKRFTKTAVETFLSVLDKDVLESLRDENIQETAGKILPAWQSEVKSDSLMHIASLAAGIIDFKSPFTRKHSVQIANRAWMMGGYYGFDPEKRAKVYLAASLHDLGKLATPNAILDKPDKLTDEEFMTIKAHVKGTYDMLSGITGFEEICHWASSHHEKLDGSGYHFGIDGKDLDFVDRLLACTDIYQAVSEERPYHPRRSHDETMPILWSMAEKGFIDKDIVNDFDTVMAIYSNRDVPPPEF